MPFSRHFSITSLIGCSVNQSQSDVVSASRFGWNADLMFPAGLCFFFGLWLDPNRRPLQTHSSRGQKPWPRVAGDSCHSCHSWPSRSTFHSQNGRWWSERSSMSHSWTSVALAFVSFSRSAVFKFFFSVFDSSLFVVWPAGVSVDIWTPVQQLFLVRSATLYCWVSSSWKSVFVPRECETWRWGSAPLWPPPNHRPVHRPHFLNYIISLI